MKNLILNILAYAVVLAMLIGFACMACEMWQVLLVLILFVMGVLISTWAVERIVSRLKGENK